VPRLIAIILVPVLFALDQLSKWWVIEIFFRPRVFEAESETQSFFGWIGALTQERFPPARFELLDNFNLVMVWNQGISFGMLSSHEETTRLFLIISALVLVLGLLVWLMRTTSFKIAIPLGMIIAGALANIWDRVRFGAVADFIDFHIGDWHYPAFNLADSCIVLGVAVLAFDGIILESRRLKESKEHDDREAKNA